MEETGGVLSKKDMKTAETGEVLTRRKMEETDTLMISSLFG